MAIALSVNLNKIALIRNSREGDFPRLSEFANWAVELGVQGLTVHPRPDQRHIRAIDIPELAHLIKHHEERIVEFNIEGNPFAQAHGSYPGFIELVSTALPHQCTLVPDNDEQLTSDHGFDLVKDGEKLAPIIKKLKQLDIRVSLFMDPNIEQIKIAKEIGAQRIELYTGPFAQAYAKDMEKAREIFQEHVVAAEYALKLGMGVNAGHDLNLNNMMLYKALPGLQEVSIGHALLVDALKSGFDNAISAYLQCCA